MREEDYNKKNIEMFERLSELDKGSEEYIALRNELWIYNRRLIFHIIKSNSSHFITDYCDYEDIVQECEIFLMKAIEHFDLTKDCNFSTYAWNWIRQGIRICINKNRPVHVYQDRINEVFKNTEDEQSKFIKNLIAPESLDRLYQKGDLLYDKPVDKLFIYGLRGVNPDTEEPALYQNLQECLAKVLKGFKERTREILYYYYAEELTLDEIGKKYGLTRERIRQIIAKAIEKCQQECEEYGLKEYLYH